MDYFATTPANMQHTLGVYRYSNIPGLTLWQSGIASTLGGCDFRNMDDLEEVHYIAATTIDEFDTQGGGIYLSNLAAFTSLYGTYVEKIGGGIWIDACPNLTTVGFNRMTNCDTIDISNSGSDMPNLLSVGFPGLLNCRSFKVADASNCTSITAPLCTTMDWLLLTPSRLPALTSLIFENLATLTNSNIVWSSHSALTSIYLPSLTALSGLSLTSCLALETINFDLVATSGTLAFSNCPILNTIVFDSLVTCGGLSFSSTPSLNQLYFPQMTTLTSGEISYSDSPTLTYASFPLLASAPDNIWFQNNPACVQILFPSLTNCSGHIINIGVPFGAGDPGDDVLNLIDFSALQTCDWMQIEQCVSITTLDLHSLVSCNSLNISYNPNLYSVTLTNFVPTNEQQILLNANGLDVTTVNAVLARCVASAGYVSGIVDLSGGTNAAPTGQGLTDKATLIARGVIVTTN